MSNSFMILSCAVVYSITVSPIVWVDRLMNVTIMLFLPFEVQDCCKARYPEEWGGTCRFIS